MGRWKPESIQKHLLRRNSSLTGTPVAQNKENNMNDETKEILIGVVEYQNSVGTKKDKGTLALESLANRAEKVLDEYSKTKNTTSVNIDPFQVEFEW